MQAEHTKLRVWGHVPNPHPSRNLTNVLRLNFRVFLEGGLQLRKILYKISNLCGLIYGKISEHVKFGIIASRDM